MLQLKKNLKKVTNNKNSDVYKKDAKDIKVKKNRKELET